jgi:hypothetical protein
VLSRSQDLLDDILTLIQIIYTIKYHFAVVYGGIAWYLKDISDNALTLVNVHSKIKCYHT